MKSICTLLTLVCMYCSAQTTLVKQVHMGTRAYPVNGRLLFAGLDPDNNYQLWVSDGTEAGTMLLKSFTNGSMYEADNGGGNPGLYAPVIFNDELYFFAFVGEVGHGIDLWKSDGTLSGTVSLGTFTRDFSGNNFHPGTVSFCVFNNALYFSCGDNSRGAALWKTDGGSPVKVVDIKSGADIWGPAYMTVFNGAMYFMGSDGLHGVELWKSDGTATGTSMLKDIFPGANGVENNSTGFTVLKPQFTVAGNYLYFTGYRNEDFNFYNLYRTDGTVAGTIRLDSTVYVYDVDSYLQPYQADANGKLLFTAYPNGLNTNTSGIYSSDGTISGTTQLATGNHLISAGIFTNFNNKVYFAGAQGTGAAQVFGLCVSDGTTAGTSMMYAFPQGNSSAYTLSFLNTGSSLFFRELLNVSSSSSSYRVVQTDGTNAGTHIFYGAVAWGPTTLHNGYIYFMGSDSLSGEFGLYKLLPVPDNALPVKLTAFDLSLTQQQNVALSWQTSFEKNSTGFNIERSTDGYSFTTIGFVPSAGESSNIQQYFFEDKAPVEGSNYYRLKQTDADGKYAYTEIKLIKIYRENNRITIFPNPCTGSVVEIRHQLPEGSKLRVRVTGINGTILSEKECVTGTNPVQINISTIPAGIYIVIINKDGSVLHSEKFMKQ